MIPQLSRPFLYSLICYLLTLHAAFAGMQKAEDGVVKILAIGNSFSADAIENNLYDLAKEKGIKTIVANLYIGGAPLVLHVNNARENKASYSYRKTDVNGERTTVSNVSLEKALMEEDWDYISLQQASPFSGQFQTVAESLPELVTYVKGKAKNPNVKLMYHQTWAYSEHAVHPGFANYNRDQQTMYRAIVDVSQRVPSVAPIDFIIPAGTAIQNARTSYIGDNFDRDGYHLRFSLGRYVAACTWFEKIFGESVVGLKYKPADVTELEKEVAQYAAHYAVQRPYEVTPLKKFRKGPKGLKNPAAAILIDFGGVSHEGSWNPIISPLAGKQHPLKDSLLNHSRIVLEMLEPFEGKNSDGTRQPETPYHFPASVTSSSYFGTAKNDQTGNKQAKFKLTGLEKKGNYDIALFASRISDTLGVQETLIVCEGEVRQEVTINATNNTSEVGSVYALKPAKDGSITFTVTAGSGNTNPKGLFYLSALRLEAKKAR